MENEKKYFCMVMREQNGEQSYAHRYLIMAKDMEEAEEIGMPEMVGKCEVGGGCVKECPYSYPVH